jgi:exodeoxyribonuclease VII small subunit
VTKPPARSGAADSTRPAADDIAALTYEQARDELVGVVARLEAGGASLEESLALWERGEALASRCQQWLDGARARLATVRNAPEEPRETVPGTERAASTDSKEQK